MRDVFLNKNGLPISYDGIEDGKYSKSDGFANALYRIHAASEWSPEKRKPFGELRYTSANILRDFYSDELRTMFLGNGPTTITGRHYTATHDDFRLDEPLAKLGEIYGIDKLEAAPVAESELVAGSNEVRAIANKTP